MKTIRRSIDLLKQSWAILKQDRELAWLPILSAVITLLVAAIVLVPLAIAQGLLDADASTTTDEVSVAVYIALAALAVAVSFISIFFRAALVSGANERMTGGDPTVASAISGAASRIAKLFSWAVITTIVGTILRAIEERSGLIGKFVIGLVGMAWAVTTFLVIPVIVIENIGAVQAIKRSVNLFKHTWGENLSAQIGFSLLGFFAFIPVIAIGAIGGFIGSAAGFALIGLAIAAGIVLVTVLSALGGIFQTALYHYAVGTELHQGIDTQLLQDSFARR